MGGDVGGQIVKNIAESRAPGLDRSSGLNIPEFPKGRAQVSSAPATTRSRSSRARVEDFAAVKGFAEVPAGRP
jgi:hypothetical protein